MVGNFAFGGFAVKDLVLLVNSRNDIAASIGPSRVLSIKSKSNSGPFIPVGL